MASVPSKAKTANMNFSITGLQLQSLNKDRKGDDDEEDDLPSSYCTIILNGTKAFKTRTKPKNSGPFFNASVEVWSFPPIGVLTKMLI